MLQPKYDTQTPEMTKLVAKAAFPDGSLAIDLRDQLGPIFEDSDFTELYPELGQPALSPARLALITILQFADDLPDRQAAIAVRSHIDWKYALLLELTDPGFHYSVLSEFRQRLVDGGSERMLLEKLLHQCATKGLLNGKHKQRTDSTCAVSHRLVSLPQAGRTRREVLESPNLP